MEISGIIQSGVGKGAYFTQLGWVVEQCEKTLGYKPFPGTLNVLICNRDLDKLDGFLQRFDYDLVPKDENFCSARIKKVSIARVPAAIILPSEDVRIHEKQTVEIISFCNLKHSLGLEDGQQVTISDE